MCRRLFALYHRRWIDPQHHRCRRPTQRSTGNGIESKDYYIQERKSIQINFGWFTEDDAFKLDAVKFGFL